MFGTRFGTSMILFGALVMTGCSSTLSRHDPEALRATPRPAYSVAMQQPDIIVAVSPVRQTMQIGGSIPTLLGAGISAVQDGRHALRVKEALDGYDMNQVFQEHIARRVETELGVGAEKVSPQGTSAGFNNARQARDARVAGLSRAGLDIVLDLDARYGIYGVQGLLVTSIAGELTDLQTGRVLWRNEVTSFSRELYADMRGQDPTQRMTPNITAPRLTVEENAVEQWLVDGASPLKQAFEESVAATLDALFTDLGLDEKPRGLYILGTQALMEKRYADAATLFRRAVELDRTQVASSNGLALALARNRQVDEAIQVAAAVAKHAPDYAPVHYNLAYWYAVDKKDAASARPHYERALALGATPGRRLERAMR